MIHKKNKIRIILGVCLIVFGVLWIPESESAQIGQYFLIGNILLFSLLMEILPLWFRYQYRSIITLLQHFAETYDKPLDYSYTPVVVIKNHIHDTTRTTYLTHTTYQSEKTLFSIYHHDNLYDFSTDLIDKNHSIDLISVIIYYLGRDIPYEILHQHSKRLAHIL